MPRSPYEFISFVATHFRPIEAMCRQHVRFSSDEEIVAFLRPFQEEDKTLTRLIGRMREVGVLAEFVGEWAPPSFLVDFVERLSQRYALASPKVIQSWVEALRDHVTALLKQIDSSNFDLGAFDVDGGRFLLREIADVFHTIVGTIEDNCERIATEVADYRRVEDSSQLRSRLTRLIHLHDEYLEPVIRIVDITGDFYAVTDQISNCCARLVAFTYLSQSIIEEEARFIQKEVIWLRRVIVHRAEEARRELAPLCEAAARESKIAKGVNRALDEIYQRRWDSLALEKNFTMVDEKDGTLFSDSAIERYLRFVLETKARTPPRISTETKGVLEIPVVPEDVIDRLASIGTIDDLMDWILDTCSETDLDSAVRLFQSILELRPDCTQHTEERRDYSHRVFVLNAPRWCWKGTNNGNNGSDTKGEGDRSTGKTRERVSAAKKR